MSERKWAIAYGTKIFRRRALGQYIVWQSDLRYTHICRWHVHHVCTKVFDTQVSAAPGDTADG